MSHRFLRKILRLFLIAMLIAGFPLSAGPTSAGPTRVPHAATFTVNSTADAVDANPGNGTCATAGGTCTLRAAIQEANALPGDDAILLPSGTYTLTIVGAGEDTAATGDLDITSNIVISSTGLTRPIVVGNGDRVIQITGTVTSTIFGITIQNGVGTGGGIWVSDPSSNLALNNSTVMSNTSDAGGGILNSGVLTITNSTVSGNTVFGMGGCAVGGGIANVGTLMLISSTVSGNSADGYGGGIYNDGTLAIINSTISGNSVSCFTGGGIYNGGFGGSGTITMSNSSVISNTAPSGTGGIANGNGMISLRNTILGGNTGTGGQPADCAGTVNSLGYNLIQSSGCFIVGSTSGNITGQSPKVAPLQDNGGPTFTHALLFGSSAIDAGNPTGCTGDLDVVLNADQRGVQRQRRCDIGAYEYDGPFFQVFLPVITRN